MSVKGRIVTDMIRFFTAQKMLGPKIQDGTLRKNLVEAPWHCPEEYINLPIHMRQFEMELLTPKEEDCGEVILQLHGGGLPRGTGTSLSCSISGCTGGLSLAVIFRIYRRPDHIGGGFCRRGSGAGTGNVSQRSGNAIAAEADYDVTMDRSDGIRTILSGKL